MLLFSMVIPLIFSILHAASPIPQDSIGIKLDTAKFVCTVSKRMNDVNDKIIKSTNKTLDKAQKQEEKIYRKLLKTKDSLYARAHLGELNKKYAAIRNQLENPAIPGLAKQYLPHLDSLNISLQFLGKDGVGKIPGLQSAARLQDRFKQADIVKDFLRERKEELRSRLEGLGLVKQLKHLNKQVYYYAQQIKEYKEILKDPTKIEKKVIELLSKTKAWKDFFKKNSVLASLFRLPDDPMDPAFQPSLNGLQTRAQINSLIQQRIGNSANASQLFQQNVQSAQSQLNALKNKILNSGSGSNGEIMPEGFKPNPQKTKTFLQRLEYSVSIQNQKAKAFFPITSDIGLSVGFKPNEKSVLGIGTSYKLGWGTDWQHIKMTHQGLGLRLFIDLKVKGSFWLTGGYEQNYKSIFDNVAALRNYDAWSKSGLMGISKIIAVKSKFFQKAKTQLLWDFLSYIQVPKTEALIFRISYKFK
jgi:hypothetical protein